MSTEGKVTIRMGAGHNEAILPSGGVIPLEARPGDKSGDRERRRSHAVAEVVDALGLKDKRQRQTRGTNPLKKPKRM